MVVTFDEAKGQYRVQNNSAATQAVPAKTYDGDGAVAKEEKEGGTTFYLRSAALGGQAVAEYAATGRNPAWEYDPDGRLVSRNEATPDNHTYVPLRGV